MTRGGGVKIWRGALKIFTHPKGAGGSSEIIVGLGGGLQKFVYVAVNFWFQLILQFN